MVCNRTGSNRKYLDWIVNKKMTQICNFLIMKSVYCFSICQYIVSPFIIRAGLYSAIETIVNVCLADVMIKSPLYICLLSWLYFKKHIINNYSVWILKTWSVFVITLTNRAWLTYVFLYLLYNRSVYIWD